MKLWQFFLAFLLTPSLFAQERVPSLQQHELRLEGKIRESLKHYLQPKDYVLRVSVLGNPYLLESALQEVESPQRAESLPGFSNTPQQLISSAREQSSQKVIPTLWEVSSVQVDLIMHKEVSSSIQEYLMRSVPLITGLIPERGDAFNFLPITPNEVVEDIPEEEPPAELPVQPMTWYEQLYQQIQQYGIWGWLVIGIIVLLLLVLVLLLFKKTSKRNEEPSQPVIPDLKQQFEKEQQEIEKERKKKMQDFFAQRRTNEAFTRNC